MKHRIQRSTLAAAAVAVLSTVWSGAGYACSSEPYLSSVCVMAWARTTNFGNTYMPAQGATLNVSQYAALYALLGNTYGGSGQTTFQLPDLRGRVIVGAGQGPGLPLYPVGQAGGTPSVTLLSSQMPMHVHPVVSGGGVTLTTGIGSLAATTTLTGLTATTSLSGVTATASSSGLSLKGYSGTAGTGSANGAALATPAGPANRIYASSTPDVTMMAGSIAGNAPVTFTGNPTTTINGNPTTTLSGAPEVTINGTTGAAGASQPISIMQPFLAMNYFIAVNGLFPSPD